MLLKKTPSQKKKEADRLLKRVEALKTIEDKEVDFEEPDFEKPATKKRMPKEAVIEVDEVEIVEDAGDDPLLQPKKKMGRPRLNPDETVQERRARERRERQAERAGVQSSELVVSSRTKKLMNEADDLLDDPGSDIVISTGDEPISKLGVRGQRTIIGRSAEEIHQLIEKGHADAATTLIYKRLLQSIVDTLPYMEMVIRKSKGQKGAYAYNSMVSSVRELMTDIQQSQDRGRQGEILVERFILPVFLDIGMAMMQEFDLIAQSLRRDPDITDVQTKEYDKLFHECQVRFGQQLQAKLKEVREQCRKFLQR